MTPTAQTSDLYFNCGKSQAPFHPVTGQAATEKKSVVTLEKIRQAAGKIAPFIKRTPTVEDPILSGRFNSNFYLKLELLQKTGAFKVRGAFNKMLSLDEEEKKRRIVAVSGGNHAKAVAFAAKTLGFRALILMPENTPRNYIDETKADGAEVQLFPSMGDAFVRAEKYELEGCVYVHPFDDELIIAGQGTIGLEILEDVPQVTDVIVSIGGGGLAGGVAVAIKSLKPEVKIWGVETKGAESMTKALQANLIVELSEVTSIARTLGAPAAGKINFDLAKKYLSGTVVVSDDEAVKELLGLLESQKVLTEPAASCTLAAAERLKVNFRPGSHVVSILCGGNFGLGDLFSLRKANPDVRQ